MLYSQPMVKVMISIPEDLLGRVDELAKREGASRSALIREALRRYLVQPVDLERRRVALDHLREAFANIPPDFLAEDFIRWDRDHGH